MWLIYGWLRKAIRAKSKRWKAYPSGLPLVPIIARSFVAAAAAMVDTALYLVRLIVLKPQTAHCAIKIWPVGMPACMNDEGRERTSNRGLSSLRYPALLLQVLPAPSSGSHPGSP